MKNKKIFTSKRFILVVLSFIVVSYIGIIAVHNEAPEVSITAIGILGGIISWYIKKESDRPST